MFWVNLVPFEHFTALLEGNVNRSLRLKKKIPENEILISEFKVIKHLQ